MKINRILILLMIAVALGATAARRTPAQEKPATLAGEWVFNRARSDNALEKLRGVFARASSATQLLAVRMFPSKTLVIVGDAEKIAIDATFEEITEQRILATDARLHRDESGDALLTAATFANGILTIETVNPDRLRLVESFRLTPDGALENAARIFARNGREIVAVTSIFERVAANGENARR